MDAGGAKAYVIYSSTRQTYLGANDVGTPTPASAVTFPTRRAAETHRRTLKIPKTGSSKRCRLRLHGRATNAGAPWEVICCDWNAQQTEGPDGLPRALLFLISFEVSVSPGFLSDGPLVLSRAPFTPAAFCDGDIPCSPVLVPLLLDVPVVEESDGFAAGPFLLPVSPLTPGPRILWRRWHVVSGILCGHCMDGCKKSRERGGCKELLHGFPSFVFASRMATLTQPFMFPGARRTAEKGARDCKKKSCWKTTVR